MERTIACLRGFLQTAQTLLRAGIDYEDIILARADGIARDAWRKVLRVLAWDSPSMDRLLLDPALERLDRHLRVPDPELSQRDRLGEIRRIGHGQLIVQATTVFARRESLQ